MSEMAKDIIDYLDVYLDSLERQEREKEELKKKGVAIFPEKSVRINYNFDFIEEPYDEDEGIHEKECELRNFSNIYD
jgi:GrpB-like predicted nucleotidyltransferase (UPF0157 family)